MYERRNPIDFSLLLWAGALYFALKSDALQSVIQGLKLLPRDGDGEQQIPGTSFSILSATRLEDGWDQLRGTTKNFNIQISHTGPGGSGRVFKIAAWGDRPSIFTGSAYRNVGWYGDKEVTFNDDVTAQAYDVPVALPASNLAVEGNEGVFDLTVQVQTQESGKLVERRFEGVLVV